MSPPADARNSHLPAHSVGESNDGADEMAYTSTYGLIVFHFIVMVCFVATVTHTYVDLLQGTSMCVLYHINQGQRSLYC